MVHCSSIETVWAFRVRVHGRVAYVHGSSSVSVALTGKNSKKSIFDGRCGNGEKI